MDENNISKRKRNYSPRKLEKAIKSIEDGTHSALQASREFDIPRSTLISKTQGTRPRGKSRPGPKCVLGDETEETLCEWIIEISKKGFGLTKDGLWYTVRELLKSGHACNTVATFDPEKGPGRRWFESFFRRHDDLRIRRAEYLHKCRGFATEAVIRKWFVEVSEDLEELINLFEDPSRVYNCDETAINLHPKKPPIIAQKDIKRWNILFQFAEVDISIYSKFVIGQPCTLSTYF